MAEERESNQAPQATEPHESHPVSGAVGTVAGAAAGAVVGAVGGPAGMAAGAVAGGVLGGMGGSATGEGIDHLAETPAPHTSQEPEGKSGLDDADGEPARTKP
jgi:phage tail tape-measure protein